MGNGFKIKYKDLYDLEDNYNKKLNKLINQIDQTSKAIETFILSTHYTGQAALATKTYMADVHLTLLAGMKVLAQNLLDNFALYKAGYYPIDSSTNFILNETAMCEYGDTLKNKLYSVWSTEDTVSNALNDIADLFWASKPTSTAITTSTGNIRTEISKLVSDVTNLESQTTQMVQNSSAMMVSSLKKSIASAKVNYSGISTYKANSFFQDKDAYTFAALSQYFYDQHEENKEIFDQIWAYENERKEEADQRKEDGIWKTIGGVGLVVGGAACIFFTAGAATPVVIAGAAAGTGTIAFGVADSVEGGYEIYYGTTGDISSASINYLRDTIFQGNQQAYGITESIFAFTASALVPIGAAEKAGTLTFRSGSVAIGKLALSGAAGSGASKYTMEATGNRALSMLAGMGASTITGIGLNAIDRKFYISHPHEMRVADPGYLGDDGKIDWNKYAPNDGIEPGTLQENQTLRKGTIIDRYGSEYGKYTSPEGTPYDSRSLPYKNNPHMYNKYRVIQDLDGVDTSTIAEAFNRGGGGIQYQLPQSVKELVKLGYLERIPVVENYINPASVISDNSAFFAGERYRYATEKE